MANVDKPNGFRPFRYLNGAPYNGAATKYVIPASDATATFVGDLVKLHSTGDATTGLRGVIQAAAGTAAAVCGVIVGMEVDPTNLNTPQYRAASTKRVVYVADDPNLLFVAQEDGDSTTLAMADAGLNCDIVVGTGSSVTGASAMEIDSSGEATTATLPLKLIEPVQAPDNDISTSTGTAYTRWVVKLNNHQLAASTGTAGV